MNGLNDSYVESIIRKASSGKLTTGQAEIDTGPEPSVEEIRFKSKERVETSYLIMTITTFPSRFDIPFHRRFARFLRKGRAFGGGGRHGNPNSSLAGSSKKGNTPDTGRFGSSIVLRPRSKTTRFSLLMG